MNLLFIFTFILSAMIGAVIGLTYSTNQILKHDEAEYYVVKKHSDWWIHVKED